ncbi:hypothetical protein Tco_0078603 [Tanacetum coccineum]
MVEYLRYFNSLEKEGKSLQSQLELQRTQFANENNHLLVECYYNDHMCAILRYDIDQFVDVWNENRLLLLQSSSWPKLDRLKHGYAIIVHIDSLSEIQGPNTKGFQQLPQKDSKRTSSSSPAPECQTTLEQQQRHEPSSSINFQENLPSVDTTNTQSMLELELLFRPMLYEYFNRENEVVSESFNVSDKQNITQSTPTMVDAESPQLIVYNKPDLTTLTSQVDAKENNIQAYDASFEAYAFIKPFSTPVTKVSESSSRQVDPSNMNQLYQRHPS